jgi:suppressor of ftsI
MLRAGALAAAALGLAALSGCGGSAEGAKKADAPKPDPLPTFQTGLPLTEPPVIESRRKILKTKLVAENGTVEVGGVKIANAMTYSAPGAPGGFLGPTLKVKPDDTVDIILDNRLKNPANVQRANAGSPVPVPHCPPADHAMKGMSQAAAGDAQHTNLHFHGMQVTPRRYRYHGEVVYGDDVLANLPPGRSHIRFHIPKHHDRGTFWYHAHHHGCTDDQVYRGLAGVLLVGDVRTTLPRRFRHVRTRTLALKDVEAVKHGTDWAIPLDHDWGSENLKQRTVNGLVQPKIDIRPGETQLWRVMNVSAAIWYKAALVDPASDETDVFTIVATDGNPATRPQRKRSIVLGPGHRVDILVRGRPTARRLMTLAFNQGRPPNPTFETLPLADVEPVGDAAHPIAGPPRRARLPRFPHRRGRSRTFRFSQSPLDNPPPGQEWLINDEGFRPTDPPVHARLNTTEKWTIINETTEHHPFHIHQNDFRVISVNGKRVRHPPGDQDVVTLPPWTARRGPGRVVILMPFQKFTGNFVFHCHILDHEDGGMMRRVLVTR